MTKVKVMEAVLLTNLPVALTLSKRLYKALQFALTSQVYIFIIEECGWCCIVIKLCSINVSEVRDCCCAIEPIPLCEVILIHSNGVPHNVLRMFRFIIRCFIGIRVIPSAGRGY